MLLDVSVHWFIAQALAAVAAYIVGRAIGRTSSSWGEIALFSVAALTIGWAIRRRFEDAILHLVPVDVLAYTEATLIVPPFMLFAGVVGTIRSSRPDSDRRSRAVGPLLGAFGILYLIMNGQWMLTPRVEFPDRAGVTMLGAGVVAQTRPDSCVAAALATALRAPGIGVNTTEREMALLADVRVGQGSTMVRALRAARLRLGAGAIEAKLLNCTAEQAASFASPARPALVTLRSALRSTHMVAVLGRTPGGAVLIANPWLDADAAPSAMPTGLTTMTAAEFARAYTGAAIVFTQRSSPLSRFVTVAATTPLIPCADTDEALAPASTH